MHIRELNRAPQCELTRARPGVRLLGAGKATRRIAAGAALLLLFPALSMGMNPTGHPVKKITHASNISAWHAVDPRHLVISLSPSKNYLLTLRRDCPSMNFAANVSVTTSNNTIYAGFDAVTVNGQRCGISQINKLSKSEKRALTST